MDKKNPVARSYKVIMLGEAGVGKSSLIRRCTLGTFSPQTTTTIGVNRVPTTVEVGDHIMDFEVLDTAGCFAFHTLIKSYINNLDAVIFVYDLTDKESFACLPLWNSIINRTQSKALVKLLVGNKSDLVLHREVQFKNAKNYADFEGMLSLEVSAKEEESDNIFQYLAKELRAKDKEENIEAELENNSTISNRPKSADFGKNRDSNDSSWKFKSLFRGRKAGSESDDKSVKKSFRSSMSMDDAYKSNGTYLTNQFHYI